MRHSQKHADYVGIFSYWAWLRDELSKNIPYKTADQAQKKKNLLHKKQVVNLSNKLVTQIF